MWDKVDAVSEYPISIHVPREGHDCGLKCDFRCANISIHVPREGHDKTA